MAMLAPRPPESRDIVLCCLWPSLINFHLSTLPGTVLWAKGCLGCLRWAECINSMGSRIYFLQSSHSSQGPEASLSPFIKWSLKKTSKKHLCCLEWNIYSRFHCFAVHSAPILPPKLPPFPTSKSGSEESEEFISASLEELPCLPLSLSHSLFHRQVAAQNLIHSYPPNPYHKMISNGNMP